MTDRRNYLRFFIWGAVLFVLMSTWLYVWTNKTEPEAEKTAFQIAQRQILINANNYKQHWLVNKQASKITINGVNIKFTTQGWPIVLQDGEIDCDAWMQLLWPDNEIFGQGYIANKVGSSTDNIICEYKFSGNYIIHLQLNNKVFRVNFHDWHLM